MKREYRVCPRDCKCVWAECLDGTCFCMLSVCPYTAISDGARVASPVESENGVESCTDGFESGCAGSRLALPEDDESGTKESTAGGGCCAT